jgi:tRNA threonylcarbamoyladenosine biosynthesis protein TsaB
MKMLAIDTSATACSIALDCDGEVMIFHQIMPMQQAQSILPNLKELLDAQGITLNQLEGLAFGCGPGSFTGVRIAASVIQGLGFALDLPIIPISSLAALAQAAYRDLGWKKQWVAVDARLQEVFFAVYEVNSEGLMSLVGKEILSKPENLLISEEEGWYGVGNAWEIHRDQMRFKPQAIDTARLPMASAILQLAKPKYLQQEWVSAAEALPVYLRDHVANKPL